jgi:hypothetical protein
MGAKIFEDPEVEQVERWVQKGIPGKAQVIPLPH